MNRRELLRLLAAVSIGSPLCSCQGVGGGLSQLARDKAKVSNKLAGRRVVVIGAGLSGLAAARELQSNGADVVVLEARDRVGGRIWTSTKWQNTPLDMGASWIHGQKGNPLTQLADEIGAARVETSYDNSIVYSANGAPLSVVEKREFRRLSKAVRNIVDKAQEKNRDRSILEAVQPLLLEHKDSPMSVSLIQHVLSSEFEHEYAGSVERLSTRWFNADAALSGGDVLFPQGYASVSDYLAKGLDVKHSQVVKVLHWDGAGVRIHTDKDEFRADHVIITLPLGVLKAGSVQFTPDLPPDKKEAISKLGMGVLNKLFLRFEKIFWPKDVDWLGFVSSRRGHLDEWVSFQRTTKLPILLGFTAADSGREIETWTDQQIVTSAMKILRTTFGRSTPDPLDFQISRWATDPYAQGSYSYNALGSNPKMREALRKPVENRLFFAGEATSTLSFGTTHGAYLSGLQAANNILSI